MTKILLLFGLGLALIIVEVLVPSMGMVGIAAGACIIGAIAWAFSVSTEMGINLLVAAAVLTPGFVLLAFKILPYSPLTRRLMATGFSFEDGAATDSRDVGLMGQRGPVEAILRPAGVARLDGRRVDVVSRGERVEVGTVVEVVELRGNRVVVVPVASADAASTPVA